MGALDEETRQVVERRLMAEEEFFEELLVAEEELTDQYLNEELSADERRGFEGHFLSTPERRRKLRFAKAFGRYVAENSPAARAVAVESRPLRAHAATATTWAGRIRAFWGAQGFALRTAMSFAAVVLIIGAVWFLLPPPPAPGTFVTISLSPSAVTRGGGDGPQGVRLTPGTDALKINLTLPGGAAEGSRFRVELEDEGGAIESLAAERLDAQTVSVVVPSSRLRRGQYALRVFESGAGGAERRTSDNYLLNVE